MFYMSIVDGGYKVSSTSAQNNIVSKMRNVMVSFGLTLGVKLTGLNAVFSDDTRELSNVIQATFQHYIYCNFLLKNFYHLFFSLIVI